MPSQDQSTELESAWPEPESEPESTPEPEPTDVSRAYADLAYELWNRTAKDLEGYAQGRIPDRILTRMDVYAAAKAKERNKAKGMATLQAIKGADAKAKAIARAKTQERIKRRKPLSVKMQVWYLAVVEFGAEHGRNPDKNEIVELPGVPPCGHYIGANIIKILISSGWWPVFEDDE